MGIPGVPDSVRDAESSPLLLLLIAENEDMMMDISRSLFSGRDNKNALDFVRLMTEILRQYFINHPQSIDKYTFLQNSAFTHWVKEKCSKMC